MGLQASPATISKAQRRKDALDELRQAQVDTLHFFRDMGCSEDVAMARASDLNHIAIQIEVDLIMEKSEAQ